MLSYSPSQLSISETQIRHLGFFPLIGTKVPPKGQMEEVGILITTIMFCLPSHVQRDLGLEQEVGTILGKAVSSTPSRAE